MSSSSSPARRGAVAHLPRAARPHQSSPRGASTCRARRTTRVARGAPAGDAGLGHRLHADEARCRAGGDVPDRNGIAAAAYSGDQETEDRIATEERLLRNDIKAVVATSALGMGYDKPDLTFVVHFQAPARWCPTTSRSAVPDAASSTPTWCCCAAPRIATSRTSSSSRPSRSVSAFVRCSTSSRPRAVAVRRAS